MSLNGLNDSSGGGGGGGGTVSNVTSNDHSITVTNPSGPTVDLSVAADIDTPGFTFDPAGGAGGQPAKQTASGTDASINVTLEGKGNGSNLTLEFGGGVQGQPTAGGPNAWKFDGSGNLALNGTLTPNNNGVGGLLPKFINDPGASKLIGDIDGGTTIGAVTVGSGLSLSAGTLSATGGSVNAPVAKTANYTMATADSGVLANATGGAFQVTLPASPTAGFTYFVKKTDVSANAITVVGSVGNIDNAANVTLTTQYQSLSFIFDNTNWWLI